VVIKCTHAPKDWERSVANRAEVLKAECMNKSMARRFAAEDVHLGASGSLNLARSVHTTLFGKDMSLSIGMFLPPVVD
jgi:hypothetical protein